MDDKEEKAEKEKAEKEKAEKEKAEEEDKSRVPDCERVQMLISTIESGLTSPTADNVELAKNIAELKIQVEPLRYVVDRAMELTNSADDAFIRIGVTEAAEVTAPGGAVTAAAPADTGNPAPVDAASTAVTGDAAPAAAPAAAPKQENPIIGGRNKSHRKQKKQNSRKTHRKKHKKTHKKKHKKTRKTHNKKKHRKNYKTRKI